MQTRIITVSREFGSGGASIAQILAKKLDWKLVDDSLIEEIARSAHVSRDVVSRYDECIDSWFHRLLKALWHGGYEGMASRVESAPFDAETLTHLWNRVIEESAGIGHCVIVGRGGQCILQKSDSAFHVSVHAPMPERIRRIRERDPRVADPEAYAREIDQRRANYIRQHFGQDWTNRRLYDLMVCSSIGPERAAHAIVVAAGLDGSA